MLAFYPGDNTPGCTRQMCSYRDNLSDLEATGAVLLGISPQDVASHEAWAEKKGFTFPLLADVDKKVIEAYGVGAPVIGVRRSVFVVDPAGKVAFADRKLIGATFVPIDKLVPVLQKSERRWTWKPQRSVRRLPPRRDPARHVRIRQSLRHAGDWPGR